MLRPEDPAEGLDWKLGEPERIHEDERRRELGPLLGEPVEDPRYSLVEGFGDDRRGPARRQLGVLFRKDRLEVICSSLIVLNEEEVDLRPELDLVGLGDPERDNGAALFAPRVLARPGEPVDVVETPIPATQDREPSAQVRLEESVLRDSVLLDWPRNLA